MELKIRKLEGLRKIGTFKANLDEYCQKSYVDVPCEEGILYSDENGNMIPAIELHINPKGYWDDGGITLKYVLVIPEVDVYEIILDEDTDDHRKDYLENYAADDLLSSWDE